MMVGRDPDSLPQVMEVDTDGQLLGIGEIDVKADSILVDTGMLLTHTPLFGGTVWYVSAGVSAGGAGDIADPFSTIGAAIAAASAGDAITVKAGAYTEIGLNLNKDNLELWCEIGTVLNPASGTALVVSGNYCLIKGDIDINVPAGQIGLLVSGNYCNICCGTILYGAVGLHITGTGCRFIDVAIGFQTAISYDIEGEQSRLFDCHTVGSAATIGFNIGGGADTGVLKRCTSSGHQTSGFYIEAGCQDWTLLSCSSGAGDGRWVDVDHANVWSNFTFDDRVYHTTTFDNTGPTSDNLFRIYGSVIITEFSGEVETVLAADIGNGYIELWDGTNTIDVTDSPGPAFNSLPVLSFLHKVDDNTVQIAIENSSQVRLYEDATKFGEDPNFQVTAKATAASYIRLTYSGAGASGVIHWHCQWRPLNEDGFVAAA